MFHCKTTRFCALAAITVLGASPLASQDVSVQDVVARCARAMAPAGNTKDLRTLRFETLTPGRDRGLKWEIIRPNLVRKEREGALVLLFDGRRAGYLEGPRLPDGTLQGPHLVPQAAWHDFEMDIAIYIPAFFDFPAEYAGRTTVDGSPAHLLRVTLPMGGVVVYAIHAESFLPIRVELPEWGFQQNMGDFRAVGGFLLAHRYWAAANPAELTVLQDVAVNADLARGRFIFPAGIR